MRMLSSEEIQTQLSCTRPTGCRRWVPIHPLYHPADLLHASRVSRVGDYGISNSTKAS